MLTLFRKIYRLFDPIFLNTIAATIYDSSAIVDAFVDSLLYAFINSLPSQYPPIIYVVFLSYALISNSGILNNPVMTVVVRQALSLDISPISLTFSNTLSGVSMLSSIVMVATVIFQVHSSEFTAKYFPFSLRQCRCKIFTGRCVEKFK